MAFFKGGFLNKVATSQALEEIFFGINFFKMRQFDRRFVLETWIWCVLLTGKW